MAKKKKLEAEILCESIIRGMQEKKGTDIVLIDLQNTKNAFTDFFIICNGGSDTQVSAIADSVMEEVYKALKVSPKHKEGNQNKEWILLDYIDAVTHIFKKEKRSFYALEELWGDANIKYIEEVNN